MRLLVEAEVVEVAVKDALQIRMVRMGLTWAAEEIRVTLILMQLLLIHISTLL